MSETMGRCRSEVDDCYGGLPLVAIADAIDRLAEDVAAIKAKVDAVSPEDVKHFVESEKAWVALVTEQRDAAVRERDEARALLELAQVQRTAAYADRDVARAEVYRLKCSMTETSRERDAAIRERDEARAEVERLRGELAARQPAAPPVVVLPTVFQHSSLGDKLVALQQVKDALDAAGVAWKAVPRE